ncbi:MAG: hypothetical protein ACJ8CR_22270 [Roseiflexaceae bacterium]
MTARRAPRGQLLQPLLIGLFAEPTTMLALHRSIMAASTLPGMPVARAGGVAARYFGVGVSSLLTSMRA